VHTPSAATVEASQMTAFVRACEEATGQLFADAAAFHAFTVRELRTFWSLLLRWSALPHEGSTAVVCTDDACERARFFPDVRLGYAESLLRVDAELGADRPAVTARDDRGGVIRLTRGELRDRVERTATALLALGIGPGDRVVAVAHNDASTVIAGLAVAAVGATFSTVAPDLGAFSALARFAPIEPALLVCHLGGSIALTEKIAEIARGLPSLRAVIALDDGPAPPGIDVALHRLAAILESPSTGERAFAWPRFPFNHPLFILFSSGTTGPPKCIVHGAGGTLLEHVKEHRLHLDLGPGDKLFFQTSCSWMMWSWQLSALASGVEIVLFTGPVADPATLWRIVSEERVTVFGTSPAYLQMCADAGLCPSRALPLDALRAVLSTGSVLDDHLFDWVKDEVGPLPLQSISGGTDILGCFVLGHPNLPVHRGECQAKSLGLDVQAWSDGPVTAPADGELVCRNPFPSRPLGFHGDPGGARFHDAYFAEHPGMWTHGDRIALSASGASRILGRSDSVLNVNGVRVGPAEIYRILRGLPEIREGLAVEQRVASPAGASRLVLLVLLASGASLDRALRRRIRTELARRGSPAHVPDLILSVPDLPVTHSGKRSERAARDAVNGVRAANAGALRNPESLDAIAKALADHGAEEPSREAALGGDPLDRAVTAAWERVLDAPGISPDDDFFALGGTSLLALRLCHELSSRTGLELPPSILFEAPTLARMTAAIRGGAADAVAPLIPLRRGARGRTLFIVHGLAGDVLELGPLADHLAPDVQLVGLRARGLTPREAAHASVEAMAADYVQRIRGAEPNGPYLLAGYSFGGLVAFEMARLLAGAGQRVAFLGLLDTNVHHACLPLASRLAFRALRAMHRATDRLRDRDRRPPPAWIGLLRAALEQGLHATTGERATSELHDENLTPAMARTEDAAWRAFSAYRPRLGAARVTFFRAAVRPPDYCYPIPTWARVSGGALSVCDVPGDHFTMIRPPHAQALARAMRAAIERSAP
jgi:acetoacetyl-CoA synthetase